MARPERLHHVYAPRHRRRYRGPRHHRLAVRMLAVATRAREAAIRSAASPQGLYGRVHAISALRTVRALIHPFAAVRVLNGNGVLNVMPKMPE